MLAPRGDGLRATADGWIACVLVSCGAPTASRAASAGGEERLAESATPTATASAGLATAAASVARVRRTCSFDRRSGSSIQWWVATVGANDATTTARPSAVDSGPQ